MSDCTAGILLIGNELLSGKVSDENAFFLSSELFKLGIEVRRIIVVPDEADEVIEALHDLLRRTDLVFTSGGIGPTHDDITVAAVAKALDRPLERSDELEARVRKFFGDDLKPAHLKMATIPKGSTLVQSEKTRWPALIVGRVYVFAGVPKILKRSFSAVRELLPSGEAQRVANLFLLTDEWTLAPLLEETIEAFSEVQIGSYPVMHEPTYRVHVTLEAIDAGHVDKAVQFLIERLPPSDVVRTERCC